MVSTVSRSERNAPSAESRSKPSPSLQIGSPAKLSSRRCCPPANILQPLMQTEEERLAGPAGIADGREQPLLQQIQAGPAQKIAPALELVGKSWSQSPPVSLEPGQQPAHRPAGDLDAEVVGGHVLEMMSLVQDQSLVRRQHRRVLPVVRGLPDRQVGRQQVVVHHHDVGLRRTAAGPKQKAAIELGALEPGTEIRLGAHLVPHLRARADRQIAQGAVGGVTGPLRDARSARPACPAPAASAAPTPPGACARGRDSSASP